MIRPILARGNPRLEQPSHSVDNPAHFGELVQDMRDTLRYVEGQYNFTRGSGISAIQIGAPACISVIHFGPSEHYTILNAQLHVVDPTLIEVSEGCLSFFDYRGQAVRYADVCLEGIDMAGNELSIAANGDPNRTALLQHEYWHTRGQLYTDFLLSGVAPVHHPEMPVFTG